MSQRRLLEWVAIAVVIFALALSPAGNLVWKAATTSVASDMAVQGAAFPGLFPHAQMVGALPANQLLDVGVGVPLTNAAGLQSFIQSTSTPNSPDFRQFLTAAQFDALYSPSEAAYAKDIAYFHQFGIQVQPSANRLTLGLSANAAQMGAAFSTSFAQYRVDGQTFYGTTTTANLPSSLPISGTFGLTNALNYKPADIVAPSSWATSASPGSPQATCSGGDTPTNVWDAYRVNVLRTAGDRGSGETIAVVDAYDTGETPAQLASDLGTFDSSCGVASTTPQFQYPVPFPASINSSASSGWGGESALDMQWSHAMADQATLKPVQTPDSGFSLYSAVNYLVATQGANTISLSWGFPDVGIANGCTAAMGCNATTGGAYEVFHPVLEAAAAEGISVTVSSGDCGAADGSSVTSTDYPASDEDATGVGGTVLTLATNRTWIGSETGWSGNLSGASCNNAGGAGGGWSPQPQPWYQTGTGVKNKGLRGVPDVGTTVGSPLATFIGGVGQGVYGTSDGSPQWAGLLAVADQIAGKGVGLANPEIYAMLRSPSYSAYFHDITTGTNGYSAGTGWDPVTGVGTPVTDDAIPYIAAGGFKPIVNNLVVSLSASATSGASPLTVTYTASATGGSGTYKMWNFYWGDGTSINTRTSTLAHTYSASGTYAAQVEVFDTNGNSTISPAIMITVGGTSALTLALTASTTTPAVGASVTFTATTTGGTSPFVFGYYFGDGTYVFGGYNSKSTSPNSVGHAFQQAGTYCADATANDSASPQNGATSNILTINVGGATGSCPGTSSPLTGSIVSNRSSATVGMPISFTSTVNGGTPAYTYAWTFGDTTTATAANPAHSYTTAGTYHVDLNVTDSASHTVQTNGLTIVVTAIGAPLVVTATSNRTSATVGMPITFGSSPSGGSGVYSTYAWRFGDGTTAATANPTHSYAYAGTFHAIVNVTDSASHTATSNVLAITVTAVTAGNPTVSITSNRTSSTVGMPVAFGSTVSGGTPAYTYAWTFGDTTTSTAANPTHAYSATGTFTVSLTVTDSISHSGSSNSLSITVTAVGAALAITASGSPLTGTAPLSVAFTSVPSGGSGTYTSFAWVFGDGATASTQDPSHTYASGGTYTAKVTVTDSASQSATSGAVTITVTSPALSVTASVSPSTGAVGATFTFTATATGGSGTYTAYSWIFGDGSTGTGVTTTHKYTAAATYDATVTVTDSGSLQALSNVLAITVTPGTSTNPLTVALTASSRSGSVGTPVSFYANASQGTAPYTYLWSGLPAGCSSTSATVACTPTTAASYFIQVTVSDSSATTQTVTKGLYYNVSSGAATSNPAPTVLGLPSTEGYLLVAIIAVVAVALIAALAYSHRRKQDMGGQPPMEPYPGAPGGSYYPPRSP